MDSFTSWHSFLLTLDLQHCCLLSDFAMLTGCGSACRYIQEECHREKSLSTNVFQLGFIFLPSSVSLPFVSFWTLRYSSAIALLLRPCCLIPGLLCPLARRTRPVVLTVSSGIQWHRSCNDKGPAQSHVPDQSHLYATMKLLTLFSLQAEARMFRKSTAKTKASPVQCSSTVSSCRHRRVA